jgi:hypothetical protein
MRLENGLDSRILVWEEGGRVFQEEERIRGRRKRVLDRVSDPLYESGFGQGELSKAVCHKRTLHGLLRFGVSGHPRISFLG